MIFLLIQIYQQVKIEIITWNNSFALLKKLQTVFRTAYQHQHQKGNDLQ